MTRFDWEASDVEIVQEESLYAVIVHPDRVICVLTDIDPALAQALDGSALDSEVAEARAAAVRLLDGLPRVRSSSPLAGLVFYCDDPLAVYGTLVVLARAGCRVGETVASWALRTALAHDPRPPFVLRAVARAVSAVLLPLRDAFPNFDCQDTSGIVAFLEQATAILRMSPVALPERRLGEAIARALVSWSPDVTAGVLAQCVDACETYLSLSGEQPSVLVESVR